MSDSSQGEAGGAGEIDLIDLARTVWASKATVLLATFLALVAGAIYVLRSEPIFQANALLQLEERSGSLALPESMQALMGGGGSGAAVEAETQIARSRMVLGQAVREQKLQIRVEPRPFPILGLIPKRLRLPDSGLGFFTPFQWGNETLEVSELEVPDAWLVARGTELKARRITLRITGQDSYEIRLPDGSRHEGRARERLVLPDKGFSLMVDSMTGPAGREFRLNRLTVEAAIRDVSGNFGVGEVARNSSMLGMTYSDPDPQRSEAVLDAIAQAYQNQNLMRSASEAEKSLEFVEGQLPVALKTVADAQQALNAYRQKENSVDVTYETQMLLEKATGIEKQLSDLALQEEELRQRYTVNHPRYQLLMENRNALKAMLEETRKQTGNLPETQKEIFNLTRDLEVAQEGYVQLMNRAQELKVMRASTVGSVRIIDRAYSDGEKISPKTGRILLLSLLLGLIAGTAVVLVRKLTHKGVKGAKDLEQMGLPVFATINYAPEASGNRKSKAELPIHMLAHSDDLVAESFRSLRTSLHFGMLDAATNTVQLTSAAPAAGKSFVAVNLAVAMAQGGQKVCLIDADLRRGYLRRYFNQPKGLPGLADLLSRERDIDNVMLPGPVEGLSVILNGRHPPNPAELLMRQDLPQLLEELNRHFDMIILDSAPALAVTDPLIIARHVASTIMVVRHMETPMGEVEAVQRTFKAANQKLTGAILNGYRQDLVRKFGSADQYGYGYRYSYTSDRSDK